MSSRRTIGIGSMVVDRLRRVPRLAGGDQKAIVRELEGQGVASFVGGVTLNHMGWAAALGLPVGLFGRQADDPEGRLLRAAMDRLGIERHIRLDGRASSTAEIFIDDAGARAIFMSPGATAETSAEDVRRHFAELIRGAARVTSEVSQLPLATVLEVFRIAREAGVETVLDVDVPPSDAVPGLGDADTLDAVLRAASLLKPTREAARELLPGVADEPLALAEAFRARYGARAVIVTDGERGCAISAEGAALRIPAFRAKEVLDGTGAGDAFLGGLLVALDRGLDWEAAGRLANACGAACVEKLGAFPDDPARARARVHELVGAELAAQLATEGAAAADPAQHGIEAYGIAVEELAELGTRMDARALGAAVELILASEAAGGRVHVTGIGKPEHIARYVASLLSSTGTPATFLHGTETTHGSAGQLRRGDVVIAISNSGTTSELLHAVAAVKALGARVIAVTGGLESPLAQSADVVLDAGVKREGGGLGFAPRASIAAELLVLAALSAALERARGFTREEYHARHPAGALGKQSKGESGGASR